MPEDITWIKEGTLKGKPSVVAGCETVCGTKQTWKVGVTPALITEGKSNREIISQIEANVHQFVIKHSAKDSSGGACTGSYHSDDELAHKFEATIKHSRRGQRLIKDSELMVVGGGMTYFPITSYGSYTFAFKTVEWGENCNKPSNKGRYTVYVSETPDSGGGYEGLGGDDTPPPPSEDFNYVGIVAIMLGGVGVLLITNTLFGEKS